MEGLFKERTFELKYLEGANLRKTMGRECSRQRKQQVQKSGGRNKIDSSRQARSLSAHERPGKWLWISF
jgi:hypothetical protein